MVLWLRKISVVIDSILYGKSAFVFLCRTAEGVFLSGKFLARHFAFIFIFFLFLASNLIPRAFSLAWGWGVTPKPRKRPWERGCLARYFFPFFPFLFEVLVFKHLSEKSILTNVCCQLPPLLNWLIHQLSALFGLTSFPGVFE